MTDHDPTFCVLCLSGGHTVSEPPARCSDPIECGHEAALGEAQEETRRLRAEVHRLTSWLEKEYDQHMRFWLLHGDGPAELMPCADWCFRCKLDRATGRAGTAEERLAELENALTWQTSCTACARVLDASIADHERAEKTVEELTALYDAARGPRPPGLPDELDELFDRRRGDVKFMAGFIRSTLDTGHSAIAACLGPLPATERGDARD